MELRHLRYFIAVAEELNFSRAAERLHVSQPPLSRQIRDLEDELKVKLLDRDRQGVRLTQAGQRVLARARKLIQEAESLRSNASYESDIPEVLHLGYAPSPTVGFISKLLLFYHGSRPGGRITLHDLTHTEMLLGLRTRKLDAALTLRPSAGEMRGLKFETLRTHRIGIVCQHSSPLGRQHGVRPMVIATSKLVVYGAGEFPEYHQWVSKMLGVSKHKLIINHECNDVLGIIAGVESGCGVAVVGEFITAVAGERVRFVPFVSKAYSEDVGLLYRSTGSNGNVTQLIAAALACK